MYPVIRFFKNRLPSLKGFLFKLLYSSKKIKIGKHFKCVSFPSINLTENAKIEIKNNVFFSNNVEIRAHKESRIIFRDSVKLDRGVRILGTNKSTIELSSKVRIGLYSVINGGDSVFIGTKSLISGFVYIQTSMHRYDDKNYIQDQGYNHSPIRLGEDVWLGAHVTVLPGCNIDNGSIVGSNTVITKSFGKKLIIAGVPAKKIKRRFD
ncbi:acetyltransferase (isoleucine patch superfamily) [Thermoplasmatales archaeon SCGC AB-540-F20]|nr:acetyltransferase (isoleucine patch superfamily) [Thermoplasmatales archaeon SCGC AB-540-F20]